MNLKYCTFEKPSSEYLCHYGVKGRSGRKRGSGNPGVLDSPGLRMIRSGGDARKIPDKGYGTMLNEYNKAYGSSGGTANPAETNREKFQDAYGRLMERKFRKNPFKMSLKAVSEAISHKKVQIKSWLHNKITVPLAKKYGEKKSRS